MADLSIIQSMGLWLAGQKLEDHALYGLPIIWVGRAGKIIQFLSAMMIFVELLGPSRLRLLGKRLLALDSAERLSDSSRTSVEWVRAQWNDLVHNKPGRSFENEPADILCGLLFILFIYLLWSITPFDAWWATFLFVVLAMSVAGIWVAIAASFVAVYLISRVGAVFANYVIEPMARALDSSNPEIPVKLTTLLILAIGFAMDLFAS